jgi:hypothetical protein
MADDNKLVPWESQGGALDYGKYAEDRALVKLDKVPIVHLVQKMSPEIDSGTAQPGDVVVRIAEKGSAANPNLGKSFQAVVVARGSEYLWWPEGDDEESGGRPLARCVKGDPIPDGCDPKDTLWPDRGGTPRTDDKKGPVADQTHTFIVCLFKDGEIGAPALLSYARGRLTTGAGVHALLNQFRGPCYAAVLEFFSETKQDKDENGKPVTNYTLKAKPAGALPPDSPLLETLKAFHDANQPHLTPKAVKG